MREILFRGKRIDNGEWAYGDIAHIEDRVFIFYYNNCELKQFINDVVTSNDITLVGVFPFVEVVPETVGQYTGLKDMNGKKIFEGDIHEWHNVGNTVNRSVLKYGTFNEFEYDHNSYGWYFETPDGRQYCLEGNESEYVIITGNIHDNPELLEVRE